MLRTAGNLLYHWTLDQLLYGLTSTANSFGGTEFINCDITKELSMLILYYVMYLNASAARVASVVYCLKNSGHRYWNMLNTVLYTDCFGLLQSILPDNRAKVEVSCHLLSVSKHGSDRCA